MTRKTIVLLLLIFPCIMTGQELYDLKRCIETGLEKNYEIRIIRNNQQISENNFTPGNAGYLPSLDLSSGYSGTLNNIEQHPNSGDKIKNNNINNQNLNAGIDLNWTVFDGFNIQTNYKRLNELQQMGALNTRLTIENFIADISSEYYNYIQQNIRLKNLKSAVKLSKERLRIVEARYNIGSLSRLDLQQAKVDFNSDSSKLMKQYEILYASQVRLNQLMAVENPEKKFITADSVITFNPFLDKEEVLSNMLANNTYLLLSKKEKTLSVLDLKTAQSENYPYLRVNAGYGYSQNKYETGNTKRQDQLGLNYGITLGFSLFDGLNRSRKQKNAKIVIENRELEYQQLELSLRSDLANMWMAYQNNMELTQLEIENLQTAKENYEIAIERYKLGDLSGLELREAQNSLLEAEERQIQAEYNTKLCEISLIQISGGLSLYPDN